HVPGRGPTEELGEFHRVAAEPRAAVLPGSGSASAQSHVCSHTQLSGRMP
ncbi:hypothetical protein M9458_031897, partial [Cirrhinus mrigala]